MTDTASDIFAALAHPTRRQILQDLKDGELAAGEIAARFHATGPTISRHLSVLRQAGLVTERRDANRILYSLVGERLALSVGDFLSTVCPEQIVLREVRKRSARPGGGSASLMAITALLTPWYRRNPARVGGGPGRAGFRCRDTDSRPWNHRGSHDWLPARETLRSPRSRWPCSRRPTRSSATRCAPCMRWKRTHPPLAHLARGFGSCSQRLAILESVARAIGVATRVRALLIDRSFWYPRFPHVGRALAGPDTSRLAGIRH